MDRIISIELEALNSPTFKPIKKDGIISYGENNDYPNYLIELYQKSAEHNAIINAKSGYVFGKGLTYIKTNDATIDGKIQKFISYANRFESWNDLLPKTIINFELIDGFYFQFIYGKSGKIVSVYNLDITRIRVSECGTFYWYCEDWSDRRKREKKKAYPAYSENIKTGTCIYYCKTHRPSYSKFGDTYSVPNYIGALSAIETDVNIDLFFNTLSKYGMTAQGMLTLFNGTPENEDAQREIEKEFKKKFTGSKNAGSFMLNFADPDGTEAKLTNFSTTDLDKQFDLLSKRVTQKITSGHRIDPVLIGIDTATSWSRPQLLDKWERFQTEYVNPRQKVLLEVISIVADSQGIPFAQLFIEDLPPLGEEIEIAELVAADFLTVEEKRNYVRDKKGVILSSVDDESASSRLSIAQKLGIGGTQALQALMLDTTVIPEQKVNIMTGLYSIPEKKARKMLGLMPTLLPVGMSAEDEIIDVQFINIKNSDEALAFEESVKLKFAEVLGGTIVAVRNQILDLLAGNPETKLELIAKQLGVEVSYIEQQIAVMKEQGLLESLGTGFNITTKGLNRAENVEPVVETEIYTVYKYALSPNISSADKKGYGLDGLKSTSHDFCVKMMKKSNSGKEWTRDELSGESNDFSDDAWVYRGGFTGHKGGEITPYCNHVWKAITKKRRKNG